MRHFFVEVMREREGREERRQIDADVIKRCIYFRELAYVIVGAGKSDICKAGKQVENS